MTGSCFTGSFGGGLATSTGSEAALTSLVTVEPLTQSPA